ncbi:thermonuclease family protein [Sandaracinus amylolyticus]|uniref:thermonuclease family protein n=1 Tax=Sandaracinus amylolyticus TaxID=927083 RepID=UPI0012ECF610|nr:thermonuclease family protein [Sandaracinus amylolyticus]
MLRFSNRALIALLLGLTGCLGEPEPVDDGTYDPEVGNLFEGSIQLSDQRVLELEASDLPSTPAPCQPPQRVVITNITDGDTFAAVRESDSQPIDVRMIGVDTPETEKRNDETGEITPAECYGNEAWAFTELLRGRYVWLTYDAECQDHFGRDLAYVWVGSGPGDMWNRQLAARGFAEPLTIEPNSSNAPVIAEDSAAAQAAGLGLWSACE